MPRPTKFDRGRAELIVTFIEGGVPRSHAARAAGIAPSTLYAWIARGDAEATEALDPDDHTLPQLRAIAKDRHIDITGARTKAAVAAILNDTQSPFSEFSDAIRAADSRFLASAIGKMREVGGDDWRMWDRLLERRFPELRVINDPDAIPLDPDEPAAGAGDAQAMIDRAQEIKVKMLGTG